MSKIKLIRRNMTNDYDEYLDWIEHSLTKIDNMKDEIEQEYGVRPIKSKEEYALGFAGGLKFALDMILRGGE